MACMRPARCHVATLSQAKHWKTCAPPGLPRAHTRAQVRVLPHAQLFEAIARVQVHCYQEGQGTRKSIISLLVG